MHPANARHCSLPPLTVEVRLNRMLFYALDLSASFGTPAAEGIRSKLQHELEDASLEYAVLLFGYEVGALAARRVLRAQQ